MGGHAKRHWGYRMDNNEYKTSHGRFKEYAEDELEKLLNNTTITWISDDGKERRRIM